MTPLSVLLVDDSEIDREIICSLFDEFEDAPTVSWVATAGEGIEALRSRWFDCAVIDYRLPDGDAASMLETLGRESRPLPPALVVTGMGTERIAAKVFKNGARDYLPKDGLTSEALRQAVEDAVEGHRYAERNRVSHLLAPEDFEGLLHEVVRATGDELLPQVRSANELARELHGLMSDASPEQIDLMDALRGQSLRANRSLRDLLRFARLQACQELICPVDPADAVSLAAFAYEEDLSGVRGSLVVEPMPKVMISPHLLVELFRVLLDNSVKFRAEDPLEVRVSGSESAGRVTLCVEDNGEGIPEFFAERAFGLFQRLRSGDAYTGTGLGLALARRIVHLHGGLIWSEPAERGAKIRFTLPMADQRVC